MSKPETPLNPVIPPSMAENKAIWHIELKSQLPNNGRREGCTGVVATCTRTKTPFCKKCFKL